MSSGDLPPGLSLSSAGKLAGIPSAPGSFTFTLSASDSAGHHVEQRYTIKVIAPPHIIAASYKAKKGKLVITGERFDAMVTLLIDGQGVTLKSHDESSILVKALSLTSGPHELRVVNPDGGVASVTITVD